MSFFAGWVDTEISGQVAKAVCDKMVAPFTGQPDAKITTAVSPFVACVASERGIINQDQCLLAVVGNSAIKPMQLQDIVNSYKALGASFIETLKLP
uniref:hypothetical protein n=1 Tax=Crenothrix polyspora TaxID=360316 RepID=UPI0011786D2E